MNVDIEIAATFKQLVQIEKNVVAVERGTKASKIRQLKTRLEILKHEKQQRMLVRSKLGRVSNSYNFAESQARRRRALILSAQAGVVDAVTQSSSRIDVAVKTASKDDRTTDIRFLETWSSSRYGWRKLRSTTLSVGIESITVKKSEVNLHGVTTLAVYDRFECGSLHAKWLTRTDNSNTGWAIETGLIIKLSSRRFVHVANAGVDTLLAVKNRLAIEAKDAKSLRAAATKTVDAQLSHD